MKTHVYAVGQTETGRIILAGIFNEHNLTGRPLVATIEKMQGLGFEVSLDHLVQEASEAGWSKKKIAAWIESVRLQMITNHDRSK